MSYLRKVQNFITPLTGLRFAALFRSLRRLVVFLAGELISEPTTDKFTVVIHGQEDRPVEGNSLTVVKELPYEGLSRFGPG